MAGKPRAVSILAYIVWFASLATIQAWCRPEDSCGSFFGFLPMSVMCHENGSKQICSFLPFLMVWLGYECGACPNVTETPTPSPTSSPIESRLRVRVKDFAVSYSIPGIQREPTPNEYAEIAEATKRYLFDYFSAHFANQTEVTLVGVENSLSHTQINTASQSVYTEYEYTNFIFTSDSKTPDALELKSIMKDSITATYLDVYVRGGAKGPFQAAISVDFLDILLDDARLSSVPSLVPYEGPSSVPHGGPAATPSRPKDNKVQVHDFYLAYVIPGLHTEQFHQNFQRLVDFTETKMDHFTMNHFSTILGTDYVKLELNLKEAQLDKGTPHGRFNVYMEYSYAELSFTSTSSIPNRDDLFALMKQSIDLDYLMDYVRSIFGSAREVVMARSVHTGAPTSAVSSTLPLSTPSTPPYRSWAPSTTPHYNKPTDSEQRATIVVVKDVYMALVAPKLNFPPSQSDFERLKETTIGYFEDYLTSFYQRHAQIEFLKVEMVTEGTYYDEGHPAAKFNVLAKYSDVVVHFRKGSKVPSPIVLYTILRDCISVDFILNWVRKKAGGVFSSTNELLFRAYDGFDDARPTLVPTTLDSTPTTVPFSSTNLPTSSVPSPTHGPVVVDVTTDFYLSLVASKLDYAPTREEFDGLTKVTVEYLNQYLEKVLSGSSTATFLRMEMETTNTYYKAGHPHERFNVMIEYSECRVFFRQGLTKPPTGEALFEFMQNSITGEFILYWVREKAGDAFSSTNEVVFRRQDGFNDGSLQSMVPSTFNATPISGSHPTTAPTPSYRPSLAPAYDETPSMYPSGSGAPDMGRHFDHWYHMALAFVIPGLSTAPLASEYERVASLVRTAVDWTGTTLTSVDTYVAGFPACPSNVNSSPFAPR